MREIFFLSNRFKTILNFLCIQNNVICYSNHFKARLLPISLELNALVKIKSWASFVSSAYRSGRYLACK